ncbi:unnamed protein product [Orchesella dallaii]|uniref:Zinc finger PHD-type domain-containing protein n=1 Tax=Orchesella dallaii TaxID=48710 RepID=A0ABP1RG80_9HEXA
MRLKEAELERLSERLVESCKPGDIIPAEFQPRDTRGQSFKSQIIEDSRDLVESCGPGENIPTELQPRDTGTQDNDVLPLPLINHHHTNERFCFCGGPDDGNSMIFCELCQIWFHTSCIQMSSEQYEKTPPPKTTGFAQNVPLCHLKKHTLCQFSRPDYPALSALSVPLQIKIH